MDRFNKAELVSALQVAMAERTVSA